MQISHTSGKIPNCDEDHCLSNLRNAVLQFLVNEVGKTVTHLQHSYHSTTKVLRKLYLCASTFGKLGK